jgi:hypothetical protein
MSTDTSGYLLLRAIRALMSYIAFLFLIPSNGSLPKKVQKDLLFELFLILSAVYFFYPLEAV